MNARSPRWALWQRMTIPCQDGLVYLARLRVIQTPWFGVFVHDIYQADADQDPHDHPWGFVSIVLRGSYREELHELDHLKIVRTKTYARWSAHYMGRRSAHRITHAAPGLRTLIFTGKRHDGWGFYTPQGYVPWQEYEARRA